MGVVMLIYDIEALVIALVSVFITIYSIVNYKRRRLWYDLLLIVIGILWTSLYLYVLLSPPITDPVWFGQTFIRPLNWLTLTVIIILRRYLLAKQRVCKNGEVYKNGN